MTDSDSDPFILSRGPPLIDANSRRRFIPPSPDSRPLNLFQFAINRCTIPAPRLIRVDDRTQMLILIDGACSGNGTPEARAGVGIFFRATGNISMRLELDGHPQTSNRAELRAAIGALEMRWWKGEGFATVVLASDSEYVVLGVCERLAKWRKNGWKTSAGRPVANRDLWERLVAKLEKCDECGTLVQFWHIPRELNYEADVLAKAGTMLNNPSNEFSQIYVLDI